MTAPAVCRTHQPYPSLLMARRAADVHPLYARIRCPRCDDGDVFEPFKCADDPSHWHCGHASPREGEPMMAPADAHPETAPFRGGDLWVAVSAGGKGQPVEIVSVNNVNVYFRAFGRGSDRSQKYKLAHDAFRVRYAPLKLADDRQKRLAREERTEARPAPLGLADDGSPDPIDAAIEAVKVEAAPEPATPAPAPASALPPEIEAARPTRVGGLPAKVTGGRPARSGSCARTAATPRRSRRPTASIPRWSTASTPGVTTAGPPPICEP